MSYYEDERRRYRPTKDRQRRDSYDDDTAYNPRDSARSTGGALVRRRDSYESIEEVHRDFSPGRGGYVRETTVRKSGTRPARARSFEDDRYDYDDRSRQGGGGDRRRDGRRDDRYDRRSRRDSSDYSSRSRSRDPPRRRSKERRKSKTEEALESLGLGGLAATLLGKKEHSREREHDRDRDRGKSRGRDRAHSEDRYDSRRRSKSRGPTREQLVQALKAAVLAGAGEAIRARKEPGGWNGEKGKRILTAAISAGGVDGLISHGKGEEDHKTRNTIGSAIAGIATSRLVNGPRSKSQGRPGSPDSRRGRSQSRGGIRDLAAGGVVAAAAKKAYDSVSGRSDSRGRRRSRSASSYDSRSPSRTSRRRSLSRGVAKSLAAVGLTGAADKVDPDRRKADRRADDYDGRSRGGGYGYDDRDRDYYRDDVGSPPPGFPNHAVYASGAPRSVSRSRSEWDDAQRQGTPSYSLDYGPHHYGDPDTDSDSDLGSSSGEEKERKKGKRKTILTTGLAAVATIHAGHSVYQSYEKRHARIKAVKKGEITKEQAKANRNRDRLQDAASIGLAALGIKGAYSEMKEMKEIREEFKEKQEKLDRHKAKRAARREKYRNHSAYGSPTGEYSHSMPDLLAPQPIYGDRPGGSHGSRLESQHRQNPSQSTFYDGQGPYSASTATVGPHYYDGNPYAAQSSSQTFASGGMPGPPIPAPGPVHHNYTMPPSPIAHGNSRAREWDDRAGYGQAPDSRQGPPAGPARSWSQPGAVPPPVPTPLQEPNPNINPQANPHLNTPPQPEGRSASYSPPQAR